MDKRRWAFWKGHGAEYYAALFLQLRGYRLLMRRYKSPVGEIDLVLTKGGVLVMVEVKFRRVGDGQAKSSLDEAVLAVTHKPQHRISHAASMFIAQNPHFANAGLRYDIIAISGLSIRHIKDAWRDRGRPSKGMQLVCAIKKRRSNEPPLEFSPMISPEFPSPP